MSFYADAPAELLYAMPASGGAVTGTITTGAAAGGPDLGSTVAPMELPHNYFSRVGKSLLVEGGGFFTTGSTAPTLKFGIGVNTTIGGNTAAGNILCSTGAFTTIASVTDGVFAFRVLMTATVLGTSGALTAFGMLDWGSKGLTTTTGVPSYMMSPSATSTPFTFSTGQTTPVYIEPFAYWSTTSTAPSVTMTNFFVWGLN